MNRLSTLHRRSGFALAAMASLVLASCGGSDDTVPGAPTIGEATAGDGSASLAFTAPSSDGGDTITAYTATCTADGTSQTGTATASPVSVTGLTNKTTYSCSVTATNSVGTGEASDTVSVTPTAAVASCDTATGVAKVVCLADAFYATLTEDQQTAVINPLTLTNAKNWSNLPEGGPTSRLGLQFNELSTTQLTAAKELLAAAMGTTANQGYDQFTQVTLSDDNLATVDGNVYGSGNYVIGFLGTPSTTDKWMLQAGGHHYAANITYDAGSVVSITPSHQGVEPLTFTSSGTTYTPMAEEKAVMSDMLASFTTAELASAKVSTTFSDCLLVPGSTTNTFPTTKEGVRVGDLSAAAQAKVLAALAPWLNDLDAASAAAFTALYTADLADTYVAYSSNADGVSGDASSFFTANTDYVRIDGPGVWIEFVVQTGVVYPDLVHYHSVYRDHNTDYVGL